MKRLFLLLFFIPFLVDAQITFVGSGTVPADNGTQAGPTVTFTTSSLSAAATTGDLICMVASYKSLAGTVTFTISNAGGQTWNSVTNHSTSGFPSTRLFWCQFNGTWSANPAVTITSGTLAMSVQMYVFRPTASTYTWSVINADQGSVAGADNPITGLSMTVANADLGFSYYVSDDDNTFTHASNPYTPAGTAQYRNLSGQDIASGVSYIIESSSQSRTVMVNTSSTDASSIWSIGFRETAGTPPVAKPRRVTLIQ
jgi:hypothetical protein